MSTAAHLPTILSHLESARSVCVFFPSGASVDVVLSAVSLAKGLQALGKSVTVSSPGPVGELLKQFSGVSEVTSEIGNQNLDVSFPYTEEQVDKVSYHIDEEARRFHLVVQPKKGVAPMDATAVQFTHTGADADMIFTVGVSNLESLEQLYIGYETLFQDVPVVSLFAQTSSFGTIRISLDEHASYAEVVVRLLEGVHAAIDGETATNLLVAIEAATQTFKSLSVTAETFAVAGRLLELGARRVKLPVVGEWGGAAGTGGTAAVASGGKKRQEKAVVMG